MSTRNCSSSQDLTGAFASSFASSTTITATAIVTEEHRQLFEVALLIVGIMASTIAAEVLP